MRNNKGFTLTEILLAAALVGIIGVALASLTTAASRKSGAGSSRVMLRNRLSVALRQLRQDVHRASRVLFVQGPMEECEETGTSSGTNETPLLIIANNLSIADDKPAYGGEEDITYIAYCFRKGGTEQLSSGDPVQPDGMSGDEKTTDGGGISRVVWDTKQATPADYCPKNKSAALSDSVWLRDVKFISSKYEYSTTGSLKENYPVPLFTLKGFKTKDGTDNEYNGDDLNGQGAILDVHLIVELPSYPVVNETAEERFLFTHGGKI